jgi:hypothetical protein
MSRESLRAAMMRLTSFDTVPPFEAVVAVGRELNAVLLDDFAGRYPLSPARGLLYAACRLTHPRLSEADRVRLNDEGHIRKLLKQWQENGLWLQDRNQLIQFAKDADAELKLRAPLTAIMPDDPVHCGQADSGADNSQKKPLRLPESDDVWKLINRLRRELPKGRKLGEIALEFTEGNQRKADSLLRQVRRFRHLLDS